MKNNYFDFLNEGRIKEQERKWIYLKLESLKILKELDTYIPGEIAS